ncbi:competence/damage-inducible protein A [Galenea microaerophila]
MHTARIGLVIIGDEILSGKREDQHLKNANMLLHPRGMKVDWVRILGDEGPFLVENLQQTLTWSAQRGEIVFCFGGIGATPDDRTRQSAAQALGQPLARHPEAVKEIEAQYGKEAYPKRVLMAEYPQGAKIIPNPFNRVPGFSLFFKCLPPGNQAKLIDDFIPESEMPLEPKYGEDYCGSHHFMPGFPQMAKPMMEWVLDTYYRALQKPPTVEKAIRLIDGQESDWIDFMNWFEANHPDLRLFSLPKIDAKTGQRTIELGVEGPPEAAEKGLQTLCAEAEKRQHAYEAIPDRQAKAQ